MKEHSPCGNTTPSRAEWQLNALPSTSQQFTTIHCFSLPTDRAMLKNGSYGVPHLLRLTSISQKMSHTGIRQIDTPDIDLLNPTSRIATCEQIANAVCAFYDKTVFAYCMFNSFDIIAQLKDMGSDVYQSAGTSKRIPVPPTLAIRQPWALCSILGNECYMAVEAAVVNLLDEHDILHRSLPHCCSREGCSSVAFTALLRGIALCTAVSDPVADQVGYIIEALRNDGSINDGLFLDGDYHDRSLTLSRLLLSSAREFGSRPLLNAGIQLLRSSGVEVGYPIAQVMCSCVIREDQRRLDWLHKSATDGMKKIEF